MKIRLLVGVIPLGQTEEQVRRD